MPPDRLPRHTTGHALGQPVTVASDAIARLGPACWSSAGSYVGTLATARSHLVRARYVLHDCRPRSMVPTLRGIWAVSAGRNTAAMIEQLLADDWHHLDAATSPAAAGDSGRTPVVGFGMPLASSGAGAPGAAPEPVCTFPLAHAAALDVDWIYLIHAETHLITVHSDNGDRLGAYSLSG